MRDTIAHVTQIQSAKRVLCGFTKNFRRYLKGIMLRLILSINPVSLQQAVEAVIRGEL